VLTEPVGEEVSQIEALVERGADAVSDVVLRGVAHAMQQFNAPVAESDAER
jgi:hypothetical protein